MTNTDNDVMSENGKYPPIPYPNRGQVLQHDLRHALFTMRTGISLLEQVREDPGKFAEVKQLLDQEVANASRLVDELLGRPDLRADGMHRVGQPSPTAAEMEPVPQGPM